MRSGITEKQTQGLLDEPSKDLIGKEHFRKQALMKKLIFLIGLFFNILSNFIPHVIILCDDRDPP